MMIDFKYLWPKFGINPTTVLHLGANEGQEAEFYYNAGVQNVIWVEAIPSVFNKLEKNVAYIPGTILINACVSDKDFDEVEFKISNNDAQSSSFLELGYHTVIHPEVHYIDKIKMRTHRVDTLLRDFKLDGELFLNADLQGAELLAFKGMGDMLHKFKWVYSEVNKRPTYENCALISDVDDYLSGYGFERIETGGWVADTWTDALYKNILL